MRRVLSFLWWKVWPWHRRDPLLTAVIARRDDGWTIWWTDTVSFSPGGAFQTLDWLVEETESQLREAGGAFHTLNALVEATDGIVSGADPGGRGIVQYKIYPWGRPGVGDDRLPFDVFPVRAEDPGGDEAGQQGPTHSAFHIAGSRGDPRATEISHGGTLELRARSAEDLVQQLAELRGGRPDVLTWIRDIRELQHA